MYTRPRIVLVFLLIALAASGCGSERTSTPVPTPRRTPTPPAPTATSLPHWSGTSTEAHWAIGFDTNPAAGQLENVSFLYLGDAIHPCAFQVTRTALNPDSSFDYTFHYADLSGAMTVKGAINGRLADAATFSGNLTISLCDSIVYLHEKGLIWSAPPILSAASTDAATPPAFAAPTVQQTPTATATPAGQSSPAVSECPTPGASPISGAPGDIICCRCSLRVRCAVSQSVSQLHNFCRISNNDKRCLF
jgi:hypothetical protein